MARKEIAMNNLKQLNSNFVELLGLDLDEVKKKIELSLSLEDKSLSTVIGNSKSSVSDNHQTIDSPHSITLAYDANKPRIKHTEIFNLLLNNIDKVDFREEAGADVDKDKLKYNDYLVTCSEKVLEVAEECGLGIYDIANHAYLYNGEYWKRTNNNKIYSFLIDAANKMGVSKNTAKHITFIEQLKGQLLFLAKTHFAENDNNDKILINLLNGTFEIDGYDTRLRKPEKEDLLTYQLPFKYDENAECPIFDEYLNTVLPDKDNQKVLMEYLGYLFVKNDTLKLEKALILYGTGANGKSVLFEILNALLGGSNNVSHYSLQNLTNENGYYRAMLGNKLVNYASEINGKMDVSIFKQLVSGEPVDARLPYGDPFTIYNYGKMIFNCNQLPTSVEQTNAFFRRFLIIPFEVTIPEEQQDKQLAKKIIKSELSGVLNRVLEGLKRILDQKSFTNSEAVDASINNYKKESDNVALFIEEKGYESSEEFVLASTLFEEYKSFCFQSGYNSIGKHSFNQRLKNSGFNIKRINVGIIAYVKKNKFENNSSHSSQTS